MREKIILMYETAGYTPEKVIRDLATLLGAAILSNDENYLHYTSDMMNVDVTVVDKS